MGRPKKAVNTIQVALEAPRAAIYTRVSTEEQATEGHGLGAQEADCLNGIAHKGWQHVQTYSDPGLSGKLDVEERPGLAALMKDAEEGKFNVVVLAALDRLARRQFITFNAVERLRKAGVKLYTLREDIDTTTYDGEMKLGIYSMMANVERMNVSIRTKTALKNLATTKGVKGGSTFYGYKRLGIGKGNKDKGIEIEEGHAAIVRRIFALRDAGHGPTAIATILNREGFATQTGKKWAASTIYLIISHEQIYRGGDRYGSGQFWPKILESAERATA